MPELTHEERDRLGALKAKQPHPASVVPPANVRTEGEEIEFRRLSAVAAAEERLAALRKQSLRTQDDLDEMLALGAPVEEVRDGERKLIEADAKAAEAKVDTASDKSGSAQVRAKAESDRLAAEAAAVKVREAADNEPTPPPGPSTPIGARGR